MLRAVVHCLVGLLVLGGVPRALGEEDALLEERLREHRGRIVVVNFWAAWCGPCKKELPLLAQLQQEYDGRGVQFIGASTDAAEERDAATALIAESGVAYPVIFGLSDVQMRRMGLGSLLPATAVLDRDGTCVFRIIGEVTRERLVARLEWLLGARVTEPPEELQLPPGIDRAPYEN